ncbi:MAG: sensor histidine kinase [Nitrospiraceae bacterium]
MLSWWHRLSLAIKITTIIVLITAVSAGLTEWLEARLVQQTIEDNIRNIAMAVGRSVGKNVTSLNDLLNRKARTRELDELYASLPDLLYIVMYEFPTEPGANPSRITNAGFTSLADQPEPPHLVQRLREEGGPLIDYADRSNTHRVFLAAPIMLKNVVVGATYAEFSTLQMDEALDAVQHVSRVRRLLTWVAIVVVINLFLYLKVHRPVKQVLSAIEAVSRGTMTASVPVEDQDELGELADRFNEMVKKIRETTDDNAKLTESLRTMNDTLQMKVNEATAEVLEKNRALVRTNELLSAAQRDAARAQRLSAIGQMAATVAHKIGTPLTALSGHIQLMAEDSNLNAESRRRLQTVEAQIERTSKIIQDMLSYARRPEPVRSVLDLNACVAECLALFQPEFERRQVVLVTEWNHQARKVEGDAQQLQEVFNSMIENALDAMPAGGSLVVRVSPHVPKQPDHRTLLAVEFIDTGCGIDAEQLAQIFQPFFTTKKAGRGTGLGLAIALETVRAHEGYIEAESEPGKGSHFTIVLPSGGESC